jgi:hypothetical protein
MNQIKHSLTLNPLPNPINSPRRLPTNRPTLNAPQSLLQLPQRRRANDNSISILRLQRTIVPHPAVGKISLGRTFLLRHCGPLFESVEEAGLAEAFVVSVAVLSGRVEAAFAGEDVVFCFN